MKNSPLQSLVILGGGSAGWMAAAFLAKKIQGTTLKISLIESSEIGTIGVGEASVPAIKYFLSELGISEKDFILATHATFKLGIDFESWYERDKKFFHPFAKFGEKISAVDFTHYWTRMRSAGCPEPLDSYSLPTQMARAGKFAIPRGDTSIDGMASFNYAYHFDAALFAQYLRRYAEGLGVERCDAKVEKVQQHSSTGNIESLSLHDGTEVHGDFFIDCSGFAGLLIEGALQTGYEDWSHWLPCDRALAVPSSPNDSINPYTRCTAMIAGWKWNIPLQHRVGNGYVYASQFIDDSAAQEELLSGLDGEMLASPKLLKFKAGRRKKIWNKNVLALGLAGGFLEPLESTSIYLIQYGLTAFFENFPTKTENNYLQDRVNAMMAEHTLRLRDFLIAHYCLNDRRGETFWDYCRNMVIPGSLEARIEEYRATGSIRLDELDFFKMNSWAAILSGMQITARYYHPKVEYLEERLVKQELDNMRKGIARVLPTIPDHEQFIKNNCSIR